MRRQLRILQAKYALGIANQLIDNGFIIDLPIKDQQLYETLLPKIAEHLDGNTEVIQAAVKEYFLIQHCKAGLDADLFDITFSPKKSGIQTGFTCNVNNGTQSVRYYIKTHQYGPTKDNIKSIKPPDTKELFDGINSSIQLLARCNY
ncbi:hypothetical protein O5D80_007985 [Batrachochytrium dendrobatidis]|nr:hypothetical protein O5D80_007985 [Batrachochytrium dendrobatidis]